MKYFYQAVTLESGRAMAQTDIETLELLPIKKIDPKDNKDIKIYDELLKKTKSLLEINSRYINLLSKNTSEAERLKIQIDEMDEGTNELIYKLYRLTPDEINIIKGINE